MKSHAMRVALKHGKANTRRVQRLVATCLLLAVCTVSAGCATTNKPPAPSLSEVIRMSEEGLEDDRIIARLHESGAVYPLSATQIVDLNRNGVSTEVLDYMQQTYVASERRRERYMAGDPFWGYPCSGCRYHYWRAPPYNFPY